jgi:hypothetical protein
MGTGAMIRTALVGGPGCDRLLLVAAIGLANPPVTFRHEGAPPPCFCLAAEALLQTYAGASWTAAAGEALRLARQVTNENSPDAWPALPGAHAWDCDAEHPGHFDLTCPAFWGGAWIRGQVMHDFSATPAVHRAILRLYDGASRRLDALRCGGSAQSRKELPHVAGLCGELFDVLARWRPGLTVTLYAGDDFDA